MENTSKSTSPKYLKLERSWYQSARSTLPRAQADKVLGAIIAYFFDLEEPKLPKDAQILFEALRAQIDFKRSQSLGKSVSSADSVKTETPLTSFGNPSYQDSVFGNNPEASPEVPRGYPRGFPGAPHENLQGLPGVSGERFGIPHDISTENQNESETAKDPSTWENAYRNWTEAVQMPDGSGSVNKSTNSSYSINMSCSPASQSTNAGAGREAAVDSSSVKGAAPSYEEVRSYCERYGLSVSPDRFFDYNSQHGWLDRHGNPIRDWKKLLEAWNAREGQFPEDSL